MWLLFVRLALALQSLDGCQGLIKLITAVSRRSGIWHPTSFCSPSPRLKTWLEEKDEKAQGQKQTRLKVPYKMTLSFYFLISVKTKTSYTRAVQISSRDFVQKWILIPDRDQLQDLPTQYHLSLKLQEGIKLKL